MGRIIYPLLSLLASATRQDLARQVSYLKEENRLLRARLPKKIVATDKEKRRLLRAGKKLGKQLKELMSLVSYSTFARWVREKEDAPQKKAEPKKKPGRPRTPEDVKNLVIKIRTDTGLGYTRIMGELRKLGIKISRQTVKNILTEAGLAPDPDESSDSLAKFLQRHAHTLWQCDFATKRMWTVTGFVDLYLLIFIHLETRRCWISPCTASPDSAWVSGAA